MADIGDLAVQRHRRFDGVFDGLTVQYRQHAGMAEADRAGMRIGRRTEFGGAAAEDLGLRVQLDMHFESDDRFVLYGGHYRHFLLYKRTRIKSAGGVYDDRYAARMHAKRAARSVRRTACR